jgi:peptidoglycan hydrolase-like protein with peptidoglycan-binding domain
MRRQTQLKNAMRSWPAGVLALLVAVLWVGSPATAGIDEAYQKPRAAKTWGDLLVDFVGFQGFSKTYALVVGISEFEGYPSLPTANDPIRMRSFLTNEAGFDYVHVLTDEKATKARIDELMVDILPGMIDENDQFLFYWSGHGEQRLDARGSHVGYLPLASSPAKRYSTMISMGDIQRWDDLLEAKQALFLLDACFSGLAGHRSKAGQRDLKIDQLAKPAHHLVSAGTGDEQTIAGDRWGGSIFTDAILRGVRGEADAETSYRRDGIVSLTELVGYVKTRVSVEAPQAGWTSPITPQSRDLRSSDGEFFFLTNENKVAKLEAEGAEYQGRFELGVPVMGAALINLPQQQPEPDPAPLPRPGQEPLLDRQLGDLAAAEAGLNPGDRTAAQEALTALGFNTRGVDGIFGPNTRSAIKRWQRDRGEEPTAYLTTTQYGKLLAEAQAKLTAVAPARLEPEPAEEEQAASNPILRPSRFHFPGSGQKGKIGPYCCDDIVTIETDNGDIAGYVQFENATKTYLNNAIAESFAINFYGSLANPEETHIQFLGTDVRPNVSKDAEAGGLYMRVTVDDVRPIMFIGRPMYRTKSLSGTVELSPIPYR